MTTTEIRIEGCLKNIQKAQNTLDNKQRLLKKKADKCKAVGVSDPEAYVRTESTTSDQYWAMCDYSTTKGDIQSLNKKIAELTDRLTFWRQKKQAEDKRADVPMIPAVEEFLVNWRKSAEQYYRSEVTHLRNWKDLHKKYRAEQLAELVSIYGEHEVRYAGHKSPELKAEMKKRCVDCEYANNYIKGHFTQEVIHYEMFDGKEFDDYLCKDLDTEVIRKRIDLYERCSAVVGVITDATGLHSGDNGSINGVVVGEDGKAFVETIIAGGYAVQCLHYRTLVKPLQELKETQTKGATKESSEAQQESSQADEKPASEKISNYKEMTLEQLKNMAEQLGATYKHYDDPKIYRMRLVMAIKAKKGE